MEKLRSIFEITFDSLYSGEFCPPDGIAPNGVINAFAGEEGKKTGSDVSDLNLTIPRGWISKPYPIISNELFQGVDAFNGFK